MKLNDKIDFVGHFSMKIFKADGSVEVYEDKNLIMDLARSNMAELVGGYDIGLPINRFVIGTKGHVGTDILDYIQVGTSGFETTRTQLFSEELSEFNYQIPFDCTGATATVLDDAAEGYIDGDAGNTQTCKVQRTVSDRTVTYIITIPDNAGNASGESPVVAYTEAALYAGTDIFSMKTFPARVKEDTVKFEITWSIIF